VGAVRGLAQVVHGDDVGVGEGGRAPGLAPEALHGLPVVGVLFGEHLDRHVPAQDLVAGQVDLAHPAPAEEAEGTIAVVYRASPRPAEHLSPRRSIHDGTRPGPVAVR